MTDELRSFISILIHQHWTTEQKGLMASVILLICLSVLVETGLPWGLLTAPLCALPRLFGKKKSGISLGRLFLTDYDRVRHMHLIGPPGTGKTELTKTLCFEDIKRGRGCFIIDPKGDRELYDEVKAFATRVGRSDDLKLISATYPEESNTWNPCGLGNASELQSKFFNSNVYSEAHYAKACELGLLQTFNELTQKKPTGFALPDLARELKYLATQQKSRDLDGLFYDFGGLAQSEWARILCCEPSSEFSREISLLDVVQKNQILFVHLPTEGKSIQSSRIGRLLTQELILISGLRKSYPQLNQGGVFSVFIDEFDAFATDSFISFLNKGRSSNFMIHIAHQTLSDLKRISEEFAGQVLGNCNIHVVFRQDNPDEAEFWAKFIGTRKTTKRTYQTQNGSSTGASSNRDSQEFLISPNEIKNLGVGHCVMSVKTQQFHRRIRLPLPPRYSTATSKGADAALESRIRGRQCAPHERSSSEEDGGLSQKALNASIPESGERVAAKNKYQNLFQPQEVNTNKGSHQ